VGFTSFDFASDEKKLKLKARGMLTMVEHINSDFLAALPAHSTSAPRVECMTCHRGQVQPFLIADVLQAAWDDGQAEAVLQTFRELRARYYGAHTYDFSEQVLIRFAGQIAPTGHEGAAIEILKLNLQYFPESAMTHFTMSNAYLADGRKDEAIASMEKAVELMPGTPFLERQLKQLKGE
jgi:tetratricopeptide (TPR) repeat protein